VGADAEKLSVASGSLRNDAGLWEGKSTVMSDAKAKIETLTFTHIEAGLFATITNANDKLVTDLSGRAGEASQRFTEVANVLRVCADTYEAEDAAGKHRIDNVW
jgi:predicted MarR family transcription regulator